MGVRTPLRNRVCTKGGARARPRQMAKFRMATITNGRARARAQHMAKTTNGNHHKRARAQQMAKQCEMTKGRARAHPQQMGVRAHAPRQMAKNHNWVCAASEHDHGHALPNKWQQMAKQNEITKGRARARTQQMANNAKSQMGANEGTTNHTHMGVRTPLRNRGCTKGGARARPRQMANAENDHGQCAAQQMATFRMTTITNGCARARATNGKHSNGNLTNGCARAHNKWQNTTKSRKGVRARAPNKWQTTRDHKWARTKEQQITHRGCTKGGARARPRQMATFRMATITNGRARARAQHMAKTTNGNHHKRARAQHMAKQNVR